MPHHMMFAGTGCIADLLELWQDLKGFEHSYCFANEGKLFLKAAGFFLSRQFYSRRNFPFYSFCGLAGIKEDGEACLLRYDALGSYESVDAFCCGYGEKLIQPMLDSLINPGKKFSSWGHDTEAGVFMSYLASRGQTTSEGLNDNMVNVHFRDKMKYEGSKYGVINITKEEAIQYVVNAFESAANRDTTIGDGLHVWVMESICEGICNRESSIVPPPESRFKSKKFSRLNKYFYQLPRN